MNDMMEKFIKYAKEQFGYDISFQESSTPDTFEKLFGASFLHQYDSNLSRSDEIEQNIAYSNVVAKVNRSDFVCSGDFDIFSDISFAA